MREVVKQKYDECYQSFAIFNSISELLQYISKPGFNKAFTGKEYLADSIKETHAIVEFTKTNNFEHALSLLTNGWDEGAKELAQKTEATFKGSNLAIKSESTKRKTIYDVAGYQVSVPRYLQGIPNNMVRTQNIAVKGKVITVNKVMGYNCLISTDTIINESAKALAIVKHLEDMGYRVNLNIVNLSSNHSTKMIGLKVKIKSSNERMNISKLAFPMCHPSMLRRVFFRFKELFPYTDYSFVPGYGLSTSNISDFSLMCKGEYVLPPFIDDSILMQKELDMEQFKV